MKKMNIGDYVLVSDIPNQETLDRIRECVKKMGYRVSKNYGRNLSKSYYSVCLSMDSDGDLLFSNFQSGNRYTPQEIFAMVEGDDIKQTIDRMKQEIATLEKQLGESKKEVTYKRGDRFYVGGVEEEFILACVGGSYEVYEACLVGLTSGNRWVNHRKVNNARSVTHKEMLTLTNGVSFQLIEK